VSFPAPAVSLIVPCRNEARHIRDCLDSLLAMDYPAGRLEILVVDGESDDGTPAIVREYLAQHACIRLLNNPGRITSCALNIGIRGSAGSAVVLIGAHSEYPSSYVRLLMKHLSDSGAAAVGGVCRTVPGAPTATARGIAAALSHPFGVGNSYFRIGASSARWVDTVPFGCYRREVFERYGLFDEELVRNQDDEFNLRLAKGGGRLLLVPEITSRYYARETFAQLGRMFYQYGLYKPLVAKKLGRVMTLRQLAPAAFVVGLLVALVLAVWWPAGRLLLGILLSTYPLAALGCCAGLLRRDPKAGLASALAFPVLHLSYGLGFLAGMLRLARGRGRWKERALPVPLSR